MKGLNSSEYRDYLKVVGEVALVRTTHGRCKDGNRCEECPVTENYICETYETKDNIQIGMSQHKN